VATTTNFGWTTPDNTGYVKDGALAIRTLGSAIDTSLVDLKGGSTGQVLKKATGTDLDFTWGAGSPILQIVSATYSTQVTNTTTTYADSGLSLSITPSSSTSKVLIMITQPMAIYKDTNQNGSSTRIVRASTTIQEINSAGTGFGMIVGGPSQPTVEMLRATQTWIYIDEPATTSATTYKTQGKTQTGGANETLYYQFDGATSQIILMEIGA
jgi:hypothetical protein